MHDNLTSKAQTQRKNLQNHYEPDLLANMRAALRIRDVYPVNRIMIFIHPGSRSNKSNKRGGEKVCCPNFFWLPEISQN